MKQVRLVFGLVGLAFMLHSCDDGCTTCMYTYTGEATEQTEDWCDGELQSEIDTYYQGQEQASIIESGWSCQ